MTPLGRDGPGTWGWRVAGLRKEGAGERRPKGETGLVPTL